MRKTDSKFSVVDLLIIVAMLLVVVGMFGPQVRKAVNRAHPSATATAVAPARR